jgi:hypothetical protein
MLALLYNDKNNINFNLSITLHYNLIIVVVGIVLYLCEKWLIVGDLIKEMINKFLFLYFLFNYLFMYYLHKQFNNLK